MRNKTRVDTHNESFWHKQSLCLFPCLWLLLQVEYGNAFPSNCIGVLETFSRAAFSCHKQGIGTSTSITTLSSSSSHVQLRHVEFPSEAEAECECESPLPPVILLHGLLGSKKNLSSLGSALGKQLSKSRRVLALDLRNHGENGHDWRDSMSYGDMARDVLEFLDAQRLPRVVLVGHSVGGKVAQAAALMSPGRVAGLVVLDIAPVTYTTRQRDWRTVRTVVDALARVDLRPDTTKKDVDRALRTVVPDPALRAFLLTNLRYRDDSSQIPLQWNIHIRAIQQQLDVLAGFDLPSPSHDLKYPGDTFFIHGGASRFVRSSHIPTIANYFPNHMLTTIRGAGHWVHAEAPDDTLALLKRYLDR